ncbi:family 78 glycoside hydrolase catalytic domain [Microbacterium hominis]|uniref:alpha-L-rhamnosidase n=1 Tax=Microbacterium hominis TaxID=162426 RepID=A0A7D4QBX4_9MICO|nr:family 78 glycoside hydrolase catalytic domain [Microbacterium hominis]QKJ18917.1 family 78 glycoside hydrolase catalytic domain [Microbacterium hominis]
MHAETPNLPATWLGEWISPAEPDEIGDDRPAYVLQRAFTLDSAPLSGRLFATALGIYEAYVNGHRVGDHELAPGATNYDRTVYAQAFDVGPLLQQGVNHIQIILSDGWFRGRNGSEQTQNCWGDTTAALVQLDAVVTDETTVRIVTDAAWTSTESEIVSADLMQGQTTDFSRVPAAPVPVRVGVVQGPEPSASPSPPVRRIEELPVAEVIVSSDDVSILDFGQNITGWARLTDLGEPGTETVLEFAEHVDPGNTFTTAHLDTSTPRGNHIRYSQTDRVIAGADHAVFEPRHTVHGFRYVRVTHPGRPLDPTCVTAIVVHSDLTRAGWFECSDARINRLHEAGRWTFRDNAVDVPTDCPTRERSGWTGDFQIFAPTAAMLFDIDGFSRKWLQAVRDDQYDNGCLAMYSPDQLRMRTSDNPDRIGGGSAGWGDAAVAVPWTLYRHYGDVRVLEESWESAVAWIEYALGCARRFRHPSRVARSETPAAHEEYIWDGPFHFGEWLEPRDPNAPERDPAEVLRALFAADQGEVGTAYLHRSLRQLSEMAGVLGRADDEARFAALAADVLAAWRTEFLRADGRTAGDTQAAYVRAIAFGLIPDEFTTAASARLVELIAERDDHLGTGFLTTGMLLPVLADTGHADLAYRLLTRTGVPSWLEMLERGGTTFWENWENVDEDGTVRSGSLNHYSKGAVVGFFYSHIAGLRQDAASVGWKRFTVEPVFGGGLTHVASRLLTPAGEVRVEWRRDGDDVELTATVPAGAEARGILPGLPETPLPGGATTTLRSTIRA